MLIKPWKVHLKFELIQNNLINSSGTSLFFINLFCSNFLVNELKFVMMYDDISKMI